MIHKRFNTVRSWYKNKPVPLQLFILFVLLPTVLTALYFALLASDIYISEGRYAVRTNDPSGFSAGILNTVIPGVGAESASEDATIVRDYILSRDMLKDLDQRLKIRRHYQSPAVDFIARLKDNATTEEFIDYYRDMIEVNIDSATNITTIQVRAFAPDVAQQMGNIIIENSERLVNRLSDRIISDTLEFARNEVASAENRVRAASDALTRFRSETQSIDPGEETSAVLGIVTGLESQLASARTELIEAKSFMQADSIQVRVLESRVRALEAQVEAERKRLASEGTASDYTRLIDRYQPLIVEQELARQRYESTLTSLELARAEAQRKQRYLLSFVQPQVPDDAVEPERLKSTFIIFIVLCIVYAIGGLIWAAIKDHMRL